MFIASIMSSKSKQSDKSSSKKSRKKTAASTTTTLNLSPVVEVGEDDDNITIDNNDKYHPHHRRLGDGTNPGWDQRRSLGVGPLPFSSDDGTKRQPSNRSNRYRHHATTNDDSMPSSAVMSSPPPSPGMIYCQNIIADDTQTERLNVDVATDSVGDSGGNRSAGNSSTNQSQFPLTSFEEADLLQRAIERRAYLHDKIVAMEAAKAQLAAEGGHDTRWSQRQGENNNPRRKSQSVDVPAEIIQYSTSPQQGEDDRQQTSPRQHQRQQPHPQREEETAKRLETSTRYQSNSMRYPPPTAADNQSSRDRVTDDGLGYNMQNKYRPFDEVCEDSSGGGGAGEGTETRNGSNNNAAMSDTNSPRRRIGENHHHHRMSEISERIKMEALEFMSYESSYAKRKERLSQQLDGVRQSKEGAGSDYDHSGIYGSLEHDMDSDHAGGVPASPTSGRHGTSRNLRPDPDSPMIAGQQQQSSPSKIDSAATIDSSAWSGGHPTTQQLSRYSNMVRLGIPDVAVIRSMERDGMSNSQSLLQSLKGEYGIPLQSSTSDTSESSSVVMQYVRQSSLASNSISSTDINSSFVGEADDGNQDGKGEITPLRDDPNYRYVHLLLN